MEKINPTQKPYIKLSPLKLALTNFPFIDADFDALTDYEFLCKVVEYLNKVIANEEIVTENMQALYDAFMGLQEELQNALEEQDQKIDDYFTNTNIQAFVDYRINQMILNGDFQTLLQNAILDLNPNALKNEKRINVLNFGGTLIQDSDLENINDNLFLNSTNKGVIIDALNQAHANNSLYYYFINGDEDANTYKLFKFDLSNYDNGTVYLYVYYLMNYLNLNNPSVLFKQDFEITISDNVITDIVLSGSKSTRTLYTGSGGGGGGDTSNLPFVVFNGINEETYIQFNPNAGWYFANADYYNFGVLLNDLHSKGIDDMIMCFGSADAVNMYGKPYQYFRLRTDYITASPEVVITAYPIFDNFNNYQNYDRTDEYGNYYNGYCNYIQLGFTVDGSGNFTGIDFNYVVVNDNNETQFLPINNQRPYTPVDPYNPATKTYVDTAISSAGGNSTEVTSSFLTKNGFINTGTNPVRLFKNGDVYQLRGALSCPTDASTSIVVGTIETDYAPLEMSTHGRVQLTGTCELVTANNGNQTLWYQLVEYGTWDIDHYDWELRIMVQGPSGGFDSSDYLYLNIEWIRYEEPTI